jgi:uncharacterized protein YfdQ (DUF2303 family)
MSYDDENNNENLAATLKRVLPTAVVLHAAADPAGTPLRLNVAVPEGFKLEEIDFEKLMPNPRRTKAKASFSDADSFIAYVKTHTNASTAGWCAFNPQTFALSFAAVIDDHAATLSGWRDHHAIFVPEMSAEWKLWKANEKKSFSQVAFAEFIEANSDDITAKEGDGYPSDLQMLKMATEFVANEERVLKSSVKLQSGGVRLTYIADPDAGTTETMSMFERFKIGLPVFQGGTAWGIVARLKYRLQQGLVSFHYELVRADRAHEAAAKELITKIGDAITPVPLLMGSCA